MLKAVTSMNHLLTATLAYLVQCFGGNLGYAIVALSLGIRVALLPLTIKLARRAQRNQEILRTLQPEIDELKKRFAKKPERLWAEIGGLYRKHNYNPFDVPTLVGSFAQLPIFAMLYSTIRVALKEGTPFLWIKNLASPDFILTLVILLFTGMSACLMPNVSGNARTTMMMIQLVVTCLIVWKLAAGLGLYWASSSLVGLFQTMWLRIPVRQTVRVG
jgi:YidC/Oxa1 family membrane protein insertase